MAQGMTCDVDPTHGPAAWLITNLNDGETSALCLDDFVSFARGVADLADQDERERTDAAAEAAAAGTHPGPSEEAGPTVVRRGTSRSRRAYEARRAAKDGRVATDTAPPAQPAPAAAAGPDAGNPPPEEGGLGPD